MLPGTCDGHAVQDLEEVEVETVQQIFRGAFLGFKGAPPVEGLLGIPEYRIQRAADIEVVLHQARLALVGDHQLVVEVVEPVVHRRGGQHQDLRLGARPDDLVEQTAVTVDAGLVIDIRPPPVAEVVRLVDDDQVEVLPVELLQVYAVGVSASSGEVCVVQHLVLELVFDQGIVPIL